jgi:NTP pyrophosphatase (non-canonical NTP hydrolase)
MENQLRKHDRKKGGQSNWREDSEQSLFHRLLEEMAELFGALNGGGGASAVLGEAADVANFAMMIADVANNGPEDAQDRCSVRGCCGWATRINPNDPDKEVCEWHHDLIVEVDDRLAKAKAKGGAA